MSNAPALSPLLGLPNCSTTREQLRQLELLTSSRGGLSFVRIAAAGPDMILSYGALFSLLSRGVITAVELPNGSIGYRRAVRRRRSAPTHTEQLQLAA